MRRLAYFLILTIFVINLASCGEIPVNQDEPTQSLTQSEFPVPLTPTAALSSTPIIIRTLIPEFTPTPRLITPAPAEGTFTDQSLVSSDGEWTAKPAFETSSDGYHISLKVFNRDQTLVWTPVDTRGEGLGYMIPSPRYWSTDSRYLYYVEREVVDGCGDFFALDSSWQILDTQTGEVKPYNLPPGRGHMLSPNGVYLAYITTDLPLKLVILDTGTQAEQRIPLFSTDFKPDAAQGGGIVWAPQGDELILAVQSGNFCEGTATTHYLLIVDTDELSIRGVYEGQAYITPLDWSVTGKILVKDWNSRSWWIESATGETTTAPLP